ncbi:succinyl-diaminopimelate desuccinylase [Allocatelliglobosispora scoriae]|uniref:Succinyl-diaminopimelate desuccinylase n=1 Tax=Allocatelliglobosispora scoriae TaxID=643052 RepID=A0A841BW19_9ACTN|nr:succinyl-diaminopimelate desuccinylase [Allocatelliglobosispora scoriae]MBB5871686.1 succinyl-diaminopimelate desuccinylase [Allocatelliglobosispora scoriae]
MSSPLTPQVLADPVALTRALVDIESVSLNEREIADAIEAALTGLAHLTVERIGHTIIARTNLGREQRVVLAGHIDTVPIADNLPSRVEGDIMWGCGTSDMKSGTALALHLAATVAEPRFDVTYFFYEGEEIDSKFNGLFLVSEVRPELLAADFAILLEPTYGIVEAGCQGTMRGMITITGTRAHAARSWLGVNAIHGAGPVLTRLAEYVGRTVEIDGCLYREGLNAVGIHGGVAGNVIPDRCEVEINYRFAPDRSVAEAEAHLRELFDGFELRIVDAAPGALPGLTLPPAAEFIAATGAVPAAKLGWTDVSRFSAMGIPALNFGPGDPKLAHKPEEHVEISKIVLGAETLHKWIA